MNNIGKVKWFSQNKGYGFITAEAGGPDIFVHFSSIQMDGFKTLREGEDVQYELITTDKGLQASNVSRL